MNKKLSILIITVLVLICAFVEVLPINAQAIYTPTADFDGNIYYIIKDNDSCMSISLTMGVDIAEIQRLNNLDENCSLIAGTRLLLGRYETPTPTPGPSPTPTPVTPTPTPFAGYASVCILLYEDKNGNTIVEDYEYGIGGGAVSLTKRNGMENFTGITNGVEMLCFDEVPEGEYNISVAPPTDYNPTTNMNYPLSVKAGDKSQVNFGAQKSAVLEDQSQTADNGGKSPIIMLMGVGCMFLGAGILVVFGIMKRREDD